MEEKETMANEENMTSQSEEVDTDTANKETEQMEHEEVVKEEKEKSPKEEKKEKRFSKKKDKKDDKKDEQIAELNDKLMRTMAEFDNFRKRSEKEKTQMFEIGAKDIVEKILPIIDNFERGLGSVPEEDKESAFVQGIEQIYKQLITALESAGVKAIDAVGKEFDPNFHNAVMHDEDDSLGENVVSEELQKGYMYRDTVVRHSMVKVVN